MHEIRDKWMAGDVWDKLKMCFYGTRNVLEIIGLVIGIIWMLNMLGWWPPAWFPHYPYPTPTPTPTLAPTVMPTATTALVPTLTATRAGPDATQTIGPTRTSLAATVTPTVSDVPVDCFFQVTQTGTPPVAKPTYNVVFGIRIDNLSVAMTNTLVTDNLPVGCDFKGASPGYTLSSYKDTAEVKHQVVTWTVNVPALKTVDLQATVATRSTTRGQILNDVFVRFGTCEKQSQQFVEVKL